MQSGNTYSEKLLGTNHNQLIGGDNFIVGDPLARPNRRSGKGDRDTKDKYNSGTDPNIPRGEYKSSSRRSPTGHGDFDKGDPIETVGHIDVNPNVTYEPNHHGYANNRDSRSSRNKMNNDYQQIQQNRGYHHGHGGLGANNNSNSNSSREGKEDWY